MEHDLQRMVELLGYFYELVEDVEAHLHSMSRSIPCIKFQPLRPLGALFTLQTACGEANGVLFRLSLLLLQQGINMSHVISET